MTLCFHLLHSILHQRSTSSFKDLVELEVLWMSVD